MMTDNPVIRTMTRDDVDIAIRLAAKEGWNPGLSDAECFYAADPEGFFIAELHGEPVGTISAVRYDDGFGFVGLYIVAPGARGKGYGMELWKHAMEHLAGCNIGLDAVTEQEKDVHAVRFQHILSVNSVSGGRGRRQTRRRGSVGVRGFCQGH